LAVISGRRMLQGILRPGNNSGKREVRRESISYSQSVCRLSEGFKPLSKNNMAVIVLGTA